MAISVDCATYVIYVPQSYLTWLSGVIYELDIEQFRLDLVDWEDSEEGMAMPRTHNHNTAVLLSGVTYARAVEIVYPYTVEFEDGQYVVSCTGANHNLADVKVLNQVSLIINNAAGLIQAGTGGEADWTDGEKSQIRDALGVSGDKLTASGGQLQALDVVADDIKAKTDALPSDPADESALESILTGKASQASVDGLVSSVSALQSSVDTVDSNVDVLITRSISILGLTGQNVKWSNLVFDANHLLTGARITLYTDNTLVTPVKSWDITATYDVDGEMASYQMVEV